MQFLSKIKIRPRTIFFAFLQITMGLVSLFLFFLMVLVILWRAPFFFFILFIGILIFLPLGLKKKKLWLGRIGLSILIILMLLFFFEVPFNEVQERMLFLKTKLEKSGPQAFNFEEKLGIYGANIAMGFGSLAMGMPEIAVETLLLCVPGPEVRKWSSDFAMRSRLIRNKLVKFVDSLENYPATKTEVSMPEIQIAWNGYFTDSRRVSFALNAFRMTAKACRENGCWRIECSGWVPVKYPRHSWTKMFYVRSVDGRVKVSQLWSFKSEPLWT